MQYCLSRPYVCHPLANKCVSLRSTSHNSVMEETVEVEELPMVSEARYVMSDLFTEGNIPLWYLSYPTVSDDSNPMNYAPSDKKFIITEINEDLRETTLPVTNQIA